MKKNIFISACVSVVVGASMLSLGLKENLGQDFFTEGMVDYGYIALLSASWVTISFIISFCFISLVVYRKRVASLFLKRRVAFTSIFSFVLILGSFFFFRAEREIYTVMTRPDGKYSLVVYKKVNSYPPFSAMPGQGSDAPGEIVLVNSKKEVLNKKSLDMVWLATGDAVRWEYGHVSIKLVLDWELPN